MNFRLYDVPCKQRSVTQFHFLGTDNWISAAEKICFKSKKYCMQTKFSCYPWGNETSNWYCKTRVYLCLHCKNDQWKCTELEFSKENLCQLSEKNKRDCSGRRHHRRRRLVRTSVAGVIKLFIELSWGHWLCPPFLNLCCTPQLVLILMLPSWTDRDPTKEKRNPIYIFWMLASPIDSAGAEATMSPASLALLATGSLNQPRSLSLSLSLSLTLSLTLSFSCLTCHRKLNQSFQ